MSKLEKIDKDIKYLEAEISEMEDKIDELKKLEESREVTKAEFNRLKARVLDKIRAKRARIKHKITYRIQKEKEMKEKEEKRQKDFEEKLKKYKEKKKKKKGWF